jgi:hypothetical protein
MKKLILIFTLLSVLSACGSKEEFGNTVIDNTPGLSNEEKAVLKIANYVKNNQGEVPPLSLFTNAGLVDVNDINKESILKLLTQSDFDTVNSQEQVQAIIKKYNKAIDKVKAFAKGGDEIPTAKDYSDIGIKDTELESKIETLHVKIKELSSEALEKISLIEILKILDTI